VKNKILTVPIATIKAYFDKYTYIKINHTKRDFFSFYLKVKINKKIGSFGNFSHWKKIGI
jgi:hypothetical protein